MILHRIRPALSALALSLLLALPASQTRAETTLEMA